jgi:hypothetical protein
MYTKLIDGRVWNLLEPDWRNMMSLKDEIDMLMVTPRYGQHSPERVNVGDHSLVVCQIVQALGGTRNEQAWGLFHDLPEPYIGDIIGPLKHSGIMDKLLDLEDAYFTAISRRFNLSLEDFTPLVSQADKMAQAYEIRTLWGDDHRAHPWNLEVDPPTEESLWEVYGRLPTWACELKRLGLKDVREE